MSEYWQFHPNEVNMDDDMMWYSSGTIKFVSTLLVKFHFFKELIPTDLLNFLLVLCSLSPYYNLLETKQRADAARTLTNDYISYSLLISNSNLFSANLSLRSVAPPPLLSQFIFTYYYWSSFSFSWIVLTFIFLHRPKSRNIGIQSSEACQSKTWGCQKARRERPSKSPSHWCNVFGYSVLLSYLNPQDLSFIIFTSPSSSTHVPVD